MLMVVMMVSDADIDADDGGSSEFDGGDGGDVDIDDDCDGGDGHSSFYALNTSYFIVLSSLPLIFPCYS